MQTTHGTRTSTMASRTTTIRTTTNGSGLCGFLNEPVHCPGENISGLCILLNTIMQMQLELFPNKISAPVQSLTVPPSGGIIPIAELFEAYQSCRRNKRNTTNALAFELDYEHNLVELLEEINNRTYNPGKSIAFIVDKPVKREIFAADFRDRIVHHLLINKINLFFEKEFIFDSYACRAGKGTHLGIRRIDRFIRKCSKNYIRDCYVLKMDIKGFFMSIDRSILYQRLESFLSKKYTLQDYEIVLDLCRKIIFYDPAHNCSIKGYHSDWDSLPADKSLFHSRPGCGLPIGNLTSQVFANFYLNSFDHFMKHSVGLCYYGRYVDDIVIVHQNHAYLTTLISVAGDYLQRELGLKLHNRKTCLKHYIYGVKFLGAIIKPHRIYIANRTKGNFYNTIQKFNAVAQDHKPNRTELAAFRSSINSYLGIMKHYSTYRLRRHLIFKFLSKWWWNAVKFNYKIEKAIIKK